MQLDKFVFTTDVRTSAGFEQFEAYVNGSQTLVSQLNSMGSGTIGFGKPGDGTFTNGPLGSASVGITLDPTTFQSNLDSGYLGVSQNVSTIAHEAGHVTLPGGYPSRGSNPNEAVSNGLNAEGVASANEYQVDQEAGISMPDQDLARAIQATGSNDFASWASAAAQYFVDQHPSTARSFTYPEYYADGFVLSGAGQYLLNAGDPNGFTFSEIGWQQMDPSKVSLQENGDGSFSAAGTIVIDGRTEFVYADIDASGRVTYTQVVRQNNNHSIVQHAAFDDSAGSGGSSLAIDTNKVMLSDLKDGGRGQQVHSLLLQSMASFSVVGGSESRIEMPVVHGAVLLGLDAHSGHSARLMA